MGKRQTRRNTKRTPYGYIEMNGDVICRMDTMALAEREAAAMRRRFALIGKIPEITVRPFFA